MAAQDIGVAYVHVEPSGKGFGKSIEGDIGDAVNKASKKSSSTLISKIGGAFGKIGKVGTGAIATLAGRHHRIGRQRRLHPRPQHRERASQTQRPLATTARASPKS